MEDEQQNTQDRGEIEGSDQHEYEQTSYIKLCVKYRLAGISQG